MLCHDRGERITQWANHGRFVSVPDQRLLRAGRGYLLFFLPAQRRAMRIDPTGEGGSDLLVPWPSLIGVASAINAAPTLRLFATPTRRRPDGRSLLYHAPLMNVDSQGRLDISACDPPRAYGERQLEAWVRLVIDQTFTQTLNPLALDLGREPVSTLAHHHFYCALATSGTATFPRAALRCRDLRLGETSV